MISSAQQRRLLAIAKKLVEQKCSAYERSGVACRWLKIAESWGVKFSFYGFRYMREIFQRQRRGWRLGLGPFCFGIFKFMDKDGDTYYGYITQIATLATEILPHVYLQNEANERFPHLKHIIKKIKEKLAISVNDMHSDNFGFIGKQIVITDWGFDG